MILANEFAKLYDLATASDRIRCAINIFTYCSEGELGDPLAGRLLFILKAFRDVVDTQQEGQRIRHISNSTEDPIANLFPGNNNDVLAPIYMDVSSIDGLTNDGTTHVVSTALESVKSQISMPSAGVTHLLNGASGDLRSRSLSSSSHSTMQPPHTTNRGMTPIFHPPELPRDGSVDIDSLGGDGEIDFEAFWHMPLNSNVPSGATHFDFSSIQEISDSRVPLYGVQEFEG